ncbi:MAG: MlaD family protein [Cyanobacteria bacterium P01_D01_bin.73]
MRSRSFREGAVGLLALAGISFFVVVVIWLKDITWGQQSYRLIIEFDNAAGMKEGSSVFYRGVPVGTVESMKATSNFVSVEISIKPATLKMPRNVAVEVDQTGLIGEASLSIYPQEDLPAKLEGPGPLDSKCDRNVILCDGDRVTGNPPINYGALIRSMVKIADLVTSSDFQGQMGDAVSNLTDTTKEIQNLSKDAASLARSIEDQLATFGETAQAIGRNADIIGQTAVKAGNSIAGTSEAATLTLREVNQLLASNKGSITATLSNIQRTSTSLRGLIGDISPTLSNGQGASILKNLEVLSVHAAAAAANIRTLTATATEPDALLELRQTLTAARGTLQNVERITSDLDKLTGDEQFRDNLQRIIRGLGQLFSSMEMLQQQVALAERAGTTNP